MALSLSASSSSLSVSSMSKPVEGSVLCGTEIGRKRRVGSQPITSTSGLQTSGAPLTTLVTS